jgi:hypothetical protein
MLRALHPGGLAGSASRAVIGTLRPTEQRRAMIRFGEIYAEPFIVIAALPRCYQWS